MTFNIIPRTASGLDPIVRNSDGSPRPSLYLEKWYTGHYTGIPRQYKPTDNVPYEIKQIDLAARKRPQPAPNEYNYVIAINDDNNIYEYAGRFQAAHSSGENQDSVGVLLLLGVGQKPTPLMISKFQWLRDEFLKHFKVLATNAVTEPHYRMPGAATQCWGTAIDQYSMALKAPYPKEEMRTVTPETLFDKRVPGLQQVFIPCAYSGFVFINVTVDNPAGVGWVSSGNDPNSPSIVNCIPGQANSNGVPVGSLGGFYLIPTVETRLIVSLWGVQ